MLAKIVDGKVDAMLVKPHPRGIYNGNTGSWGRNTKISELAKPDDNGVYYLPIEETMVEPASTQMQIEDKWEILKTKVKRTQQVRDKTEAELRRDVMTKRMHASPSLAAFANAYVEKENGNSEPMTEYLAACNKAIEENPL